MKNKLTQEREENDERLINRFLREMIGEDTYTKKTNILSLNLRNITNPEGWQYNGTINIIVDKENNQLTVLRRDKSCLAIEHINKVEDGALNIDYKYYKPDSYALREMHRQYNKEDFSPDEFMIENNIEPLYVGSLTTKFDPRKWEIVHSDIIDDVLKSAATFYGPLHCPELYTIYKRYIEKLEIPKTIAKKEEKTKKLKLANM